MPPHWVLSAWAHRRELQERLRQAEAKVEFLQKSVQEAQVAVQAGILASEAARTALVEDAEATRQRLYQELSTMQPVFDPEIIAALPVEMLQAIFRELAFEHDSLWSVLYEGRYNRMRAGVPWRLAGVCSKWRSVALNMPEIWSYIAIPTVSADDPTPAVGEKLVTRMKLLLDRSTTHALDILLVCDDPDCRLTKLDWVREALNVISSCASRWRRVHLALPCDVRESDLAFLRQPTPLLEEISVSVYNDVVPWKEHHPAYLPSCPSLRTLWIPATFIPPQSALSHLTCARLPVGDEWRNRLWDALCQMAFLERLSIEFLWTEVPTPAPAPTSHLRLGHLQCLELSGFPAMVETWSQALEMPVLRKLVLRISSPREIARIATFLSTACAGIVDLHVGSPDPDFDILDIVDLPPAFRHFTELECATFFDCRISVDALRQLNTPPSRPVWPRLRSLTLEHPRSDVDHGFGAFAQALVSFVGLRVSTRHYNNGGRAPLAISITGIDVREIDNYFDLGLSLRTIEYVLGPQNCRFTAAAGKTLPAVSDSDREEDAVLTESDGSDGEASESREGGEDNDETPDCQWEQPLVVSGPEWDSDQSDDGDYLPSDKGEADSEHDSERGSGTGDD